MKQDNLISIVVTLFNKEKYIEKCLKSIAAQSYSHLEVLIIDDGSTDKSVLFAQRVIKNDVRFKIISKKNGGPASARNYGIDRATGDYIIFIDGDDYIDKDFVFNLIRYKKYDLVISGFYELLKGKPYHKCYPKEKIVHKTEFRKYIFNSSNYHYYVQVWNKLFKMDIIRMHNLKYKNIVMGEDVCFVFDYLVYCNVIKMIPNSDYCNTIIPNTLSRKKVSGLWEHNLEIVNEAKECFDLNSEEMTFLIMHSIKATLGANSSNYEDFHDNLIKIRKNNKFRKLDRRNIHSKKDKAIYFGIKLHLDFFLRPVFVFRVKQHV
ncbi:glycosyltransferase family 2 protein [Thomasclavelia spiroformis]|uniref:glycosyltransferase family 2 protein n=1 Tax=Thomasclavelia spiroformis TaxID=29348 RepID=UPI0024B15A3C|nr:glycosyltransferase family 2 protein [Thomasclavelia spiroformis]